MSTAMQAVGSFTVEKNRLDRKFSILACQQGTVGKKTARTCMPGICLKDGHETICYSKY
jgi:hypothetical protein